MIITPMRLYHSQRERTKKRVLSVVASGLFAIPAFSTEAGELNLVPWPRQVAEQGGVFFLNRQTVVTADAVFTNEAALLAEALELQRGSVSTNRILLTTDGATGLGYGCQTLRQLLEPGRRAFPCVSIQDEPRYSWRGLMLDVSRHFFDLPTLLQMLDRMADYKLNRFHLHLTDDPAWRFAVDKHPALTEIGARGNFSNSNAPAQFFTKSDLQQIVAYAAQRHIVVVPEIEMPGHAGAATRTFPELDGGKNTFNPANEVTYTLLQDVLFEAMQVFPSPWIHFGGDEVNRAAWNGNPKVAEKLKAEGMTNTQQLEGYFVRRMAQFIKEQGRTPAGWDDIVSSGADASTVVFWWRHDKPNVLTQALNSGHAVVLTPRAPCYFDYAQDQSQRGTFAWRLVNTPQDVYRGPAIPENIPPERLKQILGVQGCVWTEHIASVSYLEYMTMPRMAALAEMAWTPDSQRDYEQFAQRLQPFLKQQRSEGGHFYDADDPAGSLREANKATKRAPQLTEALNQ